MKIKSYLPLALSAGISLGIGFIGFNNSFKAPKFSEMFSFEDESEENPQEEIEGALRSMYSMRLNEKTGTIEPEWVENAIAQANALQIKNRLNKNIVWSNMGPDNVGGRTRALVIHKDSANIWFVGAVSGGLFRSNTYGQSWSPVNDMQENLNVTCLAQTPSGNIYYGTGEGGFTNLSGTRNGSPAFLGGGIFKSDNLSGTSFSLVANTNVTNFQVCNSMVAHPTLNKFYVGSEYGLFEFTENGTSLTQKKISGAAIKEVKIDNSGVIWASNNSGIVYRSDATGAMKSVKTITGGGRIAIAISPEDNNYVYILASTNTGKMDGLYRTTDGGTTWTQLVVGNTVTDIFGPNTQGWYDNVVSVIPDNKDKVLMGGVDLATWDIVNGYTQISSTFSAPWNSSYVHSDKHMIVWDVKKDNAGKVIYKNCIVGCDGGLFASDNGFTTWTSINRGYTTLQLYNVAANELGHVMGGAQDNGTYLINFKGNAPLGQQSKTAVSIYGGDGFDVEFSRFNPSITFMCTYYGTVARSGNQGQSSSTFWDKRQDGQIKTDFNTTFSLWEQDDKTSKLYLAKNSEIWAAVNPTDFANDVVWIRVAGGLGNGRIIEMDYTPDGNHLFSCKQGALFRTSGLKDADFSVKANPGVSDIPKGLVTKQLTVPGTSARTITSVNCDMSDSNHVVITLGGYGNSTFVMESKNACDLIPTWKDITGNLPSMPVYDAVVDVDDPSRIILGTDLGIWVTENGGVTWQEANQGMARVPVFEIRGYEWRPWEGMSMYIGTHGRGYFRSTTLLTGTKNVQSNKVKLNAYPNPTSDVTNFTFNSSKFGAAVVTIYDLSGKAVMTKNVELVSGSNTISMNLANLTSGYYLASVSGSTNTQAVKILVK